MLTPLLKIVPTFVLERVLRVGFSIAAKGSIDSAA